MAGSMVSVAMPVRSAGVHLEGALRSIMVQTHRDLDIMVIVYPGDSATAEAVRAIAGSDARVRILERPKPGLAAALNFALREARSDIVARMDSDDWSAPERIALQVEAMRRDPDLDAVGSGYAVIDAETGQEIDRMHPPANPEEMRWRMLLGNPVAHGSMMVRRARVREAGGYDETIERGQDYALWTRMCAKGMRIGAIPEVVYRHRMPRERRGISAGDDSQAHAVASTMVDAWAGLGASTRRDDITANLAPVVRGSISPGGAMRAIAGIMETEGPTRESLTAWLWCRDRSSMAQWPAIEAGRRARVRELGRSLRDAGVERVWVWGAGMHTRWMVEHRGSLGVAIAGVVDEGAEGQRIGEFTVESPDRLMSGDAAVVSSDTAEDALWRASAGARARGVRVWRIYGEEESAFER